MKLSIPTFVVALFAFGLPARAQQVKWTFTGSVGDEYGAALLQTFDQNGDGYPDILVGAPGYNGGRGYVRCLSGKFLATGLGSSTLWTIYPSVNAGARFGSSIPLSPRLAPCASSATPSRSGMRQPVRARDANARRPGRRGWRSTRSGASSRRWPAGGSPSLHTAPVAVHSLRWLPGPTRSSTRFARR